MSENKNGGPAFPVASGIWDFKGMTLRDWFAGQVLNGMFADAATTSGATFRVVAQEAYEMADAMLSARAEGRSNG